LRQVRIATICGSLQTASANDAVLSVVERMLVERESDVQRVDGLELVPPFRPDIDPAPEVVAWAAALGAADGLVIATPEYAAGPPGALKNGLDWLVGLSTLYRKPIVVICAGSTGGAFTIEALVRTLSYQGGLTVGTLGIGGIRTKLGGGKESVDSETLNELAALVDLLSRAFGADEPELLSLVTPVVAPHGVDPARFGLRDS
jgi:NAD(P)H-dependent FMN reductase